MKNGLVFSTLNITIFFSLDQGSSALIVYSIYVGAIFN